MTLQELEQKVIELEQTLQSHLEQDGKQIHIYQSDICHKCFSQMKLINSTDRLSEYICMNEKCQNYKSPVLIEKPEANLDCFLSTHQT